MLARISKWAEIHLGELTLRLGGLQPAQPIPAGYVTDCHQFQKYCSEKHS